MWRVSEARPSALSWFGSQGCGGYGGPSKPLEMGSGAPTRSLGLHTQVQMGSLAGLRQEGSEVGWQGQGCRQP